MSQTILYIILWIEQYFSGKDVLRSYSKKEPSERDIAKVTARDIYSFLSDIPTKSLGISDELEKLLKEYRYIFLIFWVQDLFKRFSNLAEDSKEKTIAIQEINKLQRGRKISTDLLDFWEEKYKTLNKNSSDHLDLLKKGDFYTKEFSPIDRIKNAIITGENIASYINQFNSAPAENLRHMFFVNWFFFVFREGYNDADFYSVDNTFSSIDPGTLIKEEASTINCILRNAAWINIVVSSACKESISGTERKEEIVSLLSQKAKDLELLNKKLIKHSLELNQIQKCEPIIVAEIVSSKPRLLLWIKNHPILSLVILLLIIFLISMIFWLPPLLRGKTSTISFDNSAAQIKVPAGSNTSLTPILNTTAKDFVSFGPSGLGTVAKSIENFCFDVLPATNPSSVANIFSITIPFNIDNFNAEKISLTLVEMAVIDYCIVTVNGTRLLSLPNSTYNSDSIADFSSIKYGTTIDGPLLLTPAAGGSDIPVGKSIDGAKIITLNLPITGLQTGTNNIAFNCGVIGAGNIYFKLSYSST